MNSRVLVALLTLASIVFILISRIENFGWLMVGGGFIFMIVLLFIHFLCQCVLIIRNSVRFEKALKFSIASNGLLCLASVLMPDFSDVNSYAFFGIYINPPAYFMQLTILFGALGIILSLTSVIVGWKR